MHDCCMMAIFGRFMAVFTHVDMEPKHMYIYISFPRYVLQVLLLTMRVRSLSKKSIFGTSDSNVAGIAAPLQPTLAVHSRSCSSLSICSWLTCGMGGARYLSMRMSKLAPAAADEKPSSVQHLRCSAAPVGSTDSTLHCCPPRLRRSCAAAEALATASTCAARRPPHRLYG